MKSFIRLTTLLILATAFITSCKKPVPRQTRHIPKSALFVTIINTKALQSKLEKNEATIENILKSVSGSDTTISKGKQEWEDLKASGIDLDENLYVAVVQKGGGMSAGKGTIVTSGLGTVKDEAKLEAYIKKKHPLGEITREKDYNYASFNDDKMVAWSKDLVIMMNYQKSFAGAMNYDSTTHSFNYKNPVSAENDMKTEIASYFNMKEDESVAAIPEFRDLSQEKSDAGFWINSSASIQDMALPLPKLKELFGSSFTAATLHFDDGKLTVNSKSYCSKELASILKDYKSPNADLGLIENYPSNNINGFAVFAFKPELINAIVKYLEVGGMVDGYLTKMMGANYTLEDALKAIKGDFAIVVSDFAMPAGDTTSGVQYSVPKIKMIFNVPVGDKNQMNKLMDKLVQMQMMVKAGNEYRLNPQMQKTGWQVTADDKNLLITSDEALLNQYKAKSVKAGLAKDVMDGFKGKSGVSYVNIESILNGVSAQNSAEMNNVIPKAKETFKDIKGYIESFNGKYTEGHFELRFKNEKENSLTSLLSFFETVSKNVKRNNGQANSVPVPLPDMDK